MAMLKYKDPADGLWKPVPVGGSAAVVPNEVVVDPTEPVDPAVELWLDTDDPAVPPNADDLYINTVGDAMTGQLGLVAPTLITNAARWADGIPRFATTAERDAAYAAIGGAVPGMRCMVASELFSMYHTSGGWRCPGAAASGYTSASTGGLPAGWTKVGMSVITGYPDEFGDSGDGGVVVLKKGRIRFSAQVNFSGGDDNFGFGMASAAAPPSPPLWSMITNGGMTVSAFGQSHGDIVTAPTTLYLWTYAGAAGMNIVQNTRIEVEMRIPF